MEGCDHRMAMQSQPGSCWRRPHTAAGTAELEESTPEERSGLQHTASVISAGLGGVSSPTVPGILKSVPFY